MAQDIQDVAASLSDWAVRNPIPARALLDAVRVIPEGSLSVYLPMQKQTLQTCVEEQGKRIAIGPQDC